MKASLKVIVLGCWLIVGLVDVWYFVQAPSQAMMQGVDITHYSLHREKLAVLEIGVGILLVMASFFSNRISSLLVGLSSASYLVTWFPWSIMRRFGIWRALRFKWSLASNLGAGEELPLRLWYFVGQVVLPLVFLIVIGSVIHSALSHSRPIKEAGSVTEG